MKWFPSLRRRKPHVLLLLDVPNWAFDNSAKQIAQHLSGEFDFSFQYVHHNSPSRLNPKKFDLLYVFFWGETFHQQFGFSPSRTMKEVSSHRWVDDERFGPCTAPEMVSRFLGDAETLLCTSKRLQNIVIPHHRRAFHTPNGIDTELFFRKSDRCELLTFGWAGNASDPLKGLDDILLPACGSKFKLSIAPGQISHSKMNAFYNQLDVFAVASRHEGEPLTLVEAMAAGCFPVCYNVGIVPELITHGENGLILQERSPEAFRKAFTWCQDHPEIVRGAGQANAIKIAKERNWVTIVDYFRKAFNDTIEYANGEGTRNK